MTPERYQQVTALLDAALELPTADRAAFIGRACADDLELKREVESLLASRPGVLDHSAPELATEVAAGSQLGPYRIQALLGAGGMGRVYRARDVKLGREVALKVLSKPVADDPNYLRRFQEEARLASSLNHPNIVTIYGVGEEGDVAYIAMELVRGRTLRKILAEGAPPVRKVLDLAVQVAEALAAAHAGGIIHRDLKPENVMVTSEERVKVLDFGLAKRHRATIAGEHSPDDIKTQTSLTAAGAILGTVGYMSPEQAAGRILTHATDQFSFGAILYEMLSGRRAFQRATPVETLAAIIQEQPPPIQTINAAVPAPLQQIVERCLAKNPEDRYPVTRDLAAGLHNVRNHWKRGDPPAGMMAAPAPVSTPQAWRVSRRRVMWLGGLAAVSAVSGLTAWRLWPSDSGIRSLAVLPFENAAKDDDAEFLCDGLTDSLIRQIAALPPLTVKRGNVFKGKIVDPQGAGKQLGVDAIVTGSVAWRSGKARIGAELTDVRTGAVLWSGKYDRDQADLLLIQDQIASAIIDEGIRLKLSGDDRRRLVRHATNDRDANELYLRAIFYDAKETESDYLTARKFLLEAIEKDEKFAQAFVELALNYASMAVDGYVRPNEAWPWVKLYGEKALILDPTLLEAHIPLGGEAFWNQWNWTLAERQYETAIPSTTEPTSMGYVFERWAVGRPDDALRLIRKARAVDPLGLAWKLREADLLLQTGQTQGAAEIYEEIIRDAREDPRAYFGLAEVRNTQKRFDEAIAQLRLAYEALGETDDSLLEVLAKARGADGYRQSENAGAQLELNGLATRAAANLYVSPLDFARAHARLGHTEQAFAYLDAAFADRSPGLVLLKVDHAWNSIRNEQRFRDAVKKVGLP
jgi:TolB-like protein/predicted Ser/Thr protein kinase